MLTSNPVIAAYKAAGIKLFENENTVGQIRMLQRGRFDIGVSDYFLTVMEIVRLFPKEINNFIIVEVPPYDISLAFAVSNPKSAGLFAKFEQGFDTIKKNGTYLKLMEKYWGKNNIPEKVLSDDMKQYGTKRVNMRKIPIFNLGG